VGRLSRMISKASFGGRPLLARSRGPKSQVRVEHINQLLRLWRSGMSKPSGTTLRAAKGATNGHRRMAGETHVVPMVSKPCGITTVSAAR
jgi:hypothetical protein